MDWGGPSVLVRTRWWSSSLVLNEGVRLGLGADTVTGGLNWLGPGLTEVVAFNVIAADVCKISSEPVAA